MTSAAVEKIIKTVTIQRVWYTGERMIGRIYKPCFATIMVDGEGQSYAYYGQDLYYSVKKAYSDANRFTEWYQNATDGTQLGRMVQSSCKDLNFGTSCFEGYEFEITAKLRRVDEYKGKKTIIISKPKIKVSPPIETSDFEVCTAFVEQEEIQGVMVQGVKVKLFYEIEQEENEQYAVVRCIKTKGRVFGVDHFTNTFSEYLTIIANEHFSNN